MTQEEIIENFKKVYKIQNTALVLLVAGAICLLISKQGGSEFFLGASMVLIVPGAIISLVKWRCPKCKVWLGRQRNPVFCIKCGSKFK